MKYLLTILGLALATARVFAASSPVNDDFAKAKEVTFAASSITADALAEGITYLITSVGSTDFTAIGADANLVGTVFVATGPGTGTGTVSAVATYTGSNTGATSETGEPVHATVGVGNSVWWVWTPTKTGTATIDTNGSSFDTVLAVYRSSGSSIAALTPVAYDDDVSPTNVTSKVSFTALQGATYYIAVDGYNGGARGSTGAITLHLAVGPGTYDSQNDDYADRAVIAGEYAVATGSSQFATIESGENNVVNNFFFINTVNSVWWTWTAPRAGKVTITSSMLMNGGDFWINFLGYLDVYSSTSDTITGLSSLLASDEGALGTTIAASVPSVVLTVTAGEVLQMRVSDRETTNGAQITLTVAMDSTDFNNDQFAKRSLLTGSGASDLISNSLASAQTGEPGHYEEVTADKLVSGERYMINSLGTTDFTAVGAASNTLGLEFTATASGTGTGTALHLRPMQAQNTAIITADKIQIGTTYVIASLGTTNFAAIGANYIFGPYVGEVFTATAAGTGTGTVYLADSGLLIVGKTYRIEALGDISFVNMGAASNTVGLTFTATNTGYGSGTVIPVDVITAGSFVIGRNYRIESVGTTDFTAIGASSNTVGTTFQATDVGSGTGTASTPTASKSAWWTWIAPANGYVSISTAGSKLGSSTTTPLDTLLKIYTTANLTNPTLADIVPVASNDDNSTTDVTGFVHFRVVKGTAYHIAVDSADSVRSTGAITLGLAFTSDVPLITTQVQNATAYVGDLNSAVFTVSNTGATALYDWQVKTPGSTGWMHFSDGSSFTAPALANGIATSTLVVSPINQVMNGNQYRCVISNVGGQVISNPGTLTAVYLTTYQGGSPTTNSVLGISFVAAPSGATNIVYHTSKLPAGLILNPATGVISGRIAAKPNTNYTIQYWTTYVSSSGAKSQSTIKNTVVLVNPFPASMTGSFEGLLLNGSLVPSGNVSILVTSSGVFSGKLTYKGVVYGFRGSALVLDSMTAPTQGSFTINPTSALSLLITVKTDSTMTATLKENSSLVGDVGAEGVQLKTYSAISPAPWAGNYTLAFTDPTTGPKGSGYGIVTINTKGVMSLVGNLADGTRVTASAASDATGQYRLYVPLYANRLGFLSGWLPLSVRDVSTGSYHIPSSGGSDFYWVKSAIANDKGSYPAGFGPAGLTVLMEPWIAPTNSYLIGPLGLLTSDTQTIGHFGLKLIQTGGVDNAGGNAESLPTSLVMNALSKVSVLAPDLTNARKFTVSITPKNGYYKGSFTLSDKRVVRFEGALLQLLSPATNDVFGRGYFIVPPPATPSGGTPLAGEVQFTIP